MSYAQVKNPPKSELNRLTLLDKTSFKSVEKTLKIISSKNTGKTARVTADTEPPVLICPPNQLWHCGTAVPDYFNLLSVDDNVDNDIHLTQFPGEGSFFYDGMKIDFTATDEAGNTSYCSIIVNAITPDVSPPTFTCPSNIKLKCGDVIPNYAIDPMMNLADDCSDQILYLMTPAPGNIFGGSATPVEIEYTDKAGNKSYCNFTITPDADSNSPVIRNCPGNQLLSCGSVLPDYRLRISVSDECEGTITVSQTPPPGSAFIPGMTVTIDVKDSSDNTTSCSFMVNIGTDREPPVLNCLGNQTLSCGSVLPNYAALASATDNCDSSPTITQIPAPGSLFIPGMTITLTATDAWYNSSVCTFVVNAAPDVVKPVIICRGDQTLSCGLPLPDFTSIGRATDDCDVAVVITQNPPMGSDFIPGMTVTLTATDASGNFSDCTFIVNAANDIYPPSISGCSATRRLACSAVLPDYRSDMTVSDNCDPEPLFVQDPPPGSPFVSGMAVTMTATDASGNSAVCSFIVNVSDDNIPPVISNCLGEQTLECGSLIPDYTSLLIITDNCDSTPIITQNPAPGTVFTYVTSLTITARDAAGNSSYCDFRINLLPDVTAPVLSGCPSDQILTCGSVLPDYTSLVTVTDNCDTGLRIVQSPSAGEFFTPGMTVTLTSTDYSGNRANCSFIINADSDTTKPIISGCLGDQNLSCGSAIPDYRPRLSIRDNCDRSPVVTQTPAPESIFTEKTILTITAEDASGNIETCSFNLIPSGDYTPPVITCPGDQTLALGDALPDYSAVIMVTDNCDPSPIIFQSPSAGTPFTPGMRITVSVKDFSNNYSFCYFFVNASGATGAPEIICPENQQLYAGSVLPDYVSFLQSVKDDATDNKDLIFIQMPPAGTLFNADTNVTIGVEDASGNISSCTFLVGLKTESEVIDCDHMFNVSNLDGTNGFTIYGERISHQTGYSVKNAGDVNNDGIADIIIGAPGNQYTYYLYEPVNGAAYVVFGKAGGFAPNLNLNSLNGTNGFKIRDDIESGPYDAPYAGYDVGTAGDLNGDGIADFMLSSPSAANQKGQTYIVFGKSSGFPSEIKLSDLDGNNGFVFRGLSDYESSGRSISSIGDINNDGFDDIAVITAASGAVNGRCYIVYGKNSGFPSVIEAVDLNGVSGFTISGDEAKGSVGYAVTGLGDINGDGISDFGLGCSYRNSQDKRYIIFGRSSNFPVNFNTTELNGTNGFTIKNTAGSLSYSTGITQAGDLNNDGLNDMVIGGSYILFGKSSFSEIVDLQDLNGSNGFRITGTTGFKFGYGGDFNGDGIGDYAYSSYWSSYILFGKNTWPAEVHTENDKVFRINSISSDDYSINYAGDVNHDGIDDIIIGSSFSASGKYLDDNFNPGMAFVVFGQKIADNQKPVISYCPSDEILSNGDLIPNYKNRVTIKDNCDFNPSITQSPAPGTIFDGTTTEVVLSVTDISGNSAECKFIISSNADTEAPALTCLSDQILNCDDLVPDYTEQITVSDNTDASPVVTQNPPAGSTVVEGMTITITAKDASNNSSACTFAITVAADTEKPVITSCISNQIVETGSIIRDYAAFITVRDNCDSNPLITQLPAAGTIFDGTAAEVVLSVTDISGNSAECKFIISSNADTEAPALTCLSDQILHCDDLVPDYTEQIIATDNSDPLPVVTQNPPAGSTVVEGMTITITAKDASNNSSACTFAITVAADTEKPVITSCISNQIVETGSIIRDYAAFITVRDNCDFNPSITQSPAAGTIFDGTAAEVVLSVTDISGNSAECKFIISSNADKEAPALTCLSDQILHCDDLVPDYTEQITVTDNTDPSPVVTQNPPAGSTVVEGMTITITAKDASNNESNCSFRINISSDVTAPEIICIQDQTLSCGNVIPDYTGLISVTDNCDPSPEIMQSPSAGSAFTDGMTITITAKDISNNESNCQFKINASADVTAPVIVCIGDQTLSCGSIIPDYTPLVTANDNCDPSPIITQNPSAGSVFTDGMSITITAKDISNNESYCSFKIDVSADVTAPLITCVTDQNLAFGAVLPDYRSMTGIVDNCDSDLIVTQIPGPGTNAVDGMTVIMSTIDNSGNSTSCSFKIHVTQDVEAPVFACIADQMFECGITTIPDYTKMIFAEDNTDPNPTITQTPVAGSDFSEGMTVKIIVSDKSNNASVCTFQLFTYPVLVDAGEDIEINKDQSVKLYAAASEQGTFLWSPSKGLSDTKKADPIASPLETTTYKVVFTNDDGCEAEDFVTVTVISLEEDETRYGFSPNGDGINDFWEIDKITNYPENEVLIYSRWGDLVFQTRGYDNASNVFSGIANKSRNLGAGQLPEGTYFFEIRVNQPHHFKKLKGYLVLKR